MIIGGKSIANEILEDLKIRVEKLKEKEIIPTLAIILVGEDIQSISYVEQKELKAAKIGVNVDVFNLDTKISESELIRKVNELNENSSVHGIIIQRPVANIPSEKLDTAVIPQKDVDGFNPKSKFNNPLGEAVISILEEVFELRSKVIIIDPKQSPNRNLFHSWLQSNSIAVVGKGITGGLPVIKTLRKNNYYLDEENIIDSKTKNKTEILKEADIIISAVGKSNTIKPEMIKKGAVLISIGLSKGSDGKLHGDYNEKDIGDIASFYTPTPGGVGPVNVASLLSNLVESAESISS